MFNFYSSNLRVAAALPGPGYDFRLVLGDGTHNPEAGNRAATIRRDGLCWLWRRT